MTDDPGAVDDVITAERSHLTLARRCTAAMIAAADAIGDTGSHELVSESLGRLRAERLAALRAGPDAPPFFGRIDRDAENPPAGGSSAAAVQQLHIGRRHVRDRQGDPVVIDWRAPVARGFYRATADDPMGVHLRRRFGFCDGEITGFEDEHLDRGEDLGPRSALLAAEIERPRMGPMRDIVATIAPDQDELVRSDLDTSLCVQGAPGTGKTAVGLHRAAYLLYTYPDRLRRAGVLVVGPNDGFLHHIGQVLPALGEVGVAQARVDDLVAHVPVRGVDCPEVALLKADVRMAAVLRRAVRAHVSRPDGDVVAIVGTKRYRVPAAHLRRYVDDTRRSGIRWSSGRDRLRQLIAADVRRQREDAGGAPTDAETRRIAADPAVTGFVDAFWPKLDAVALLARLYDDPDFRRRCAGPTLTDAEQDSLAQHHSGRPAGTPASTRRRARWSPADRVLIDELVGLLDGVPTYGHVVIDEAQDLSPMQCRAIARRSVAGSVTVLGDLAQATTPWAPGDWALTLDHLGHPDATVQRLTAGYRVPGSVLDLANRLLPHIATGLQPATSVRPGVGAVTAHRRADLVPTVRSLLAGVGSIGVIGADREVGALLGELADLGAAELTGDADPRLAVVASSTAKGLEFDAVVVVEPAHLVGSELDRLTGLRRLYVALTRAVSRLVLVHDSALPVELTG